MSENKSVYYCFDHQTKRFTEVKNAQIDPVATKKKGETVYMGAPSNATYIEVLPAKDGYDIFWNGQEWEYREIPKEPVEEEHEPTELDKAYQELFEALGWLAGHDYIGVKIATGRATIEDYADEIAQMRQYADKVEIAKEKIKKLEKAA